MSFSAKISNVKFSFGIIIVLILSATVVYFINEWFLSNYDSDTKQRTWYSQNSELKEEKIFLIGSSYVMRLNATEIENFLATKNQNYSVYNLGINADLESNRIRFIDEIIQSHPKLVVFGVGYRSFLSHDGNSGDLALGKSSFILPDVENNLRDMMTMIPIFNFDLYNFQNPKLTSLSLIKQIFSDEKLPDIYSPLYKENQPFSITLPHTPQNFTTIENLAEANSYQRIPRLDSPDIIALKKMIHDLSDNDIQVIVYIIPHHEIYWKNVGKTTQQNFIESLEQLSSELGIEIYDLRNKYSRFDIWDDISHLSQENIHYSNDAAKIISENLINDNSTYSGIHFNDTSGVSTHSGRPIQAEYVSNTSQLVGDKIDTAILMLRSVGNPAGIAEIGVFNENLSVKKLFGTIDASTLTNSYTEYSFSLSPSDIYTITSGDRIGIKYDGGDYENTLNIMRTIDPFDEVNSYQTYYDDSWKNYVRDDLYVLPTHSSTLPVIHMSDITSSSGWSIYIDRPIQAEYVSSTSQLVDDQINTMTLKLRKGGTPTGTAEIGVFNEDLSVKKLFGTMDASTLTNSYTEYTFSLISSELYTITSGDRIGIKYAEGNSSNYVAVMLDRDPTDPFDGINSYFTYYADSWKSNTERDLYMILMKLNFDFESINDLN